MPTKERASLTKEFPRDTVERTIQAIHSGMSLAELEAWAAANTNNKIPNLLAKRFLLVEKGAIRFDRLLVEIQAETITPRIRKAMFFAWCWRDERLRSFICNRVADSKGHWRAAVLIDKRQASYFRRSGANKARSNLEEYLAKGGMLDRASKSVHMRLDDGWLPLAIEIAAQHEKDPQTRSRLLADPAEFLISNKLHPLASASEAEVRAALAGLPPASDPVEDQTIAGAVAGTPSQARIWKQRGVGQRTRKTTTFVRDEVKFERASVSHQELERLLAELLTRAGHTAECNDSIDMFAKAAGGTLLAEIKSCTELNQLAQVRKGVAQLLEYRFIHESTIGSPVRLVLVLETSPGRDWIARYLASIGIGLAWRVGDSLVCSADLPQPFAGVVPVDP